MGRARTYGNSGPLPTVAGMSTAGGADYNDSQTMPFGNCQVPSIFPSAWIARISTPFRQSSTDCNADTVRKVWDPRYGPCNR